MKNEKSILIKIVLSIGIMITILTTTLFMVAGISSLFNTNETFLIRSESPDGEYILDAYRTEPGATVDFSVKVYLIRDDEKELIYNAYHESEAEIEWVDNETVTINGKTFDLSAGEKYDWRTQ